MVNRVIKQTNDQIRTLARGCQLVAPFILAITREFMSRRSLARLLVVFIGKSGWYIGWYICNWKMSEWAKKEVLFSQISTKIIPPEGHLLIHPKQFDLYHCRQQFWNPHHSGNIVLDVSVKENEWRKQIWGNYRDSQIQVLFQI